MPNSEPLSKYLFGYGVRRIHRNGEVFLDPLKLLSCILQENHIKSMLSLQNLKIRLSTLIPILSSLNGVLLKLISRQLLTLSFSPVLSSQPQETHSISHWLHLMPSYKEVYTFSNNQNT